jgi:hypothetical protein
MSVRFSVLGVFLATGVVALACGSSEDDKKKGIDDLFNHGPCKGLECQQAKCGSGGGTTISGTVMAPNGTLPLYNAIVYVPNKPLDPVPEGASCDHCGNVSGEPVAATLTDTKGKFTLKNAPVGNDIPLVVQVGKWRRELKVNVKECADNSTDANQTRLPKNSSEGHIPKIAVTTGWCDQLACLLPKLGLDASEYSLDHGKGRLHLFRGSEGKPQGAKDNDPPSPAPAPSSTPEAPPFWSDVGQLKTYDMLLLSCECGEHMETKPQPALDALYAYASAGGRVFASHYHYVWFQNGPPDLRGVAFWYGAPTNPENPPGPFLVDTSFPKGVALADWLMNVGASTTKGEMPISQGREDVGKVLSASAQRWVYAKKWAAYPVFQDPINPEATKYLTVNAPVGKPVDQQCGKATFADMHLYAGDVQAAPGLPDDKFPGSCSTSLTPEEKALAFLFFDLSSCVQDEKSEPTPPIK